MRAPRPRTVVVTVIVVAALVGVVLGARALWTTAKKHFTSDACTVGDYEIDPEQASVAATMVGAVTKYRVTLPDRATVLVLAAALQESKLTNIAPGYGDRDSVGVLQQRPSQDWGYVKGKRNRLKDRTAHLTDVGEATKEFLDELLRKVPDWEQMPLADAIQAVQVSADGSLYAQHEAEATALAAALQGRKAAGITCSFEKPTKVASPTTVAAQASRELGIRTPTAAGRSVRVPGAGWQTVAWFVSNADRLGIDQVAYHGRQWTRSDGWKDADASEAAVVATMHDLTS